MKLILTERQYKTLNKTLISEQTVSEKRSQEAYKLMVNGSSGLGTRPDLIVNGINLLKSNNEFHRMNTLFSDEKTGYKSFDEMINGEFEYGQSKRISNRPQFDLIKKKLNQLGVGYTISHTKRLNWPVLKLTNPQRLGVLSDLPRDPEPLSTQESISPTNVKVSQSCVRRWNNNLARAKNWLNNWVASNKTKEKFINGYKGLKYFQPNELKIIFDNYKKIIDRTPLRFYDENVTEIDGFQINKNYKENVGAYADPSTHKVYVNCINDKYSDDQWRYETLIHEIQHVLSFYFPLSPYEQVTNVFTKKQSPSQTTNKSTQTTKNINNEFNLDLSWLSNYVKHLDETQGEYYACESTEKLSNLYSVRALFGITPNQSLTKEMFLPYIKRDKHNLNITLLLSCWSKQGYPDFNTFLNGLNSLAKGNNKTISSNNSQV